MEKDVFIFQYPSVQISLKEAASGADNPTDSLRFQLLSAIYNAFLNLEENIFHLNYKLILRPVWRPEPDNTKTSRER